MPGEIWVIGEAQAGGLARVSTEIATQARDVGASGHREVRGVVIAADPAPAAEELALYLPNVLAVTAADAADNAAAASIASALAELVQTRRPDYIVLGATPDGRDIAGMLSALLGWGLLANAIGVAWGDSGPSVEMNPRRSAFCNESSPMRSRSR